MHKSSYTTFKISKDNHPIPIFTNGKACGSLYNVEREAELFANSIDAHSNFILVGGFAYGLHINALIERNPSITILVLEDTIDSIIMAQNITHIHFTENVHFCTFETLSCELKKFYIPVIHGNFVFKALQQWYDFHSSKKNLITTTIENTLKDIAADFSVQSYFGKIWHCNILKNIKTIIENKTIKLVNFSTSTFPTNKIAVIVGAGPSLDAQITILKKNRENFFIIATDTAYHSLLQQGIISDVFVTVDPQYLSILHCTVFNKNTIVVADITSSHSVLQKAILSDCNILIFKSHHPLTTLVDKYIEFPLFSAESGTVTLSALHFAKEAGFKRFFIIGTDFSYSHKPYCKGSYLDDIYNYTSSRLHTTEYQFSSLIFRTELILLSDNSDTYKVTTPVLERYKQSFLDFISKLGPEYILLDNNSLFKRMGDDKKMLLHFYDSTLVLNNFLNWYKAELSNRSSMIIPSLLPFIAWLKQKSEYGLLDNESLFRKIYKKTTDILGE
jgi:hypothetical protein